MICRDLRSLDPQWVRGSLIGYINQEPILFATSIIENIRYGKPSATDSEVSINSFYFPTLHTFILGI